MRDDKNQSPCTLLFSFPLRTSGSDCPHCRRIFSSLRTKAETERVILGTSYNPRSQRPKPPSLTKHRKGFLRWGTRISLLLKNGELEQIVGGSQMERRCLHQVVLIENPLPCFLCGLLGSEKVGLEQHPVGPAGFWMPGVEELNGADTRPSNAIFW